MGAILFLALLVVPVAELWVIVQVSGEIGVIPTLLLLLAVSVAGAWLLKQQGIATWRRLQDTMASGQIPTKEVTDGALILLGGALLLTPGFLSDVVGLVLLLPASRSALKGVVRRYLGRRARRRAELRDERAGVREARVVRVERTEPSRSSRDETPRSPLEPGERRSGEAGSRDTR